MAVLLLGSSDEEWKVLDRRPHVVLVAEDRGGPDNVRLPERGTTEHVGKEHAPGISGPRAQRSRIGNIDGGEALVRDRILRTGAVVEDAGHAVGLRTAELAVQIAELDTDDDIV